MIIYILNSSFRTLGVFSGFTSLTYTRRFADSGEFVLKLPYSQKKFDLLAEGNILMWEDDGTQAVIIDSVLCDPEKKGELMTVSGKNLRGILDRRIIWHDVHFRDIKAERIGHRLVENNMILGSTLPNDPMAASRIIPGLVLDDQVGWEPTVTVKTEHENLEEFLNNLTATTDVGFDIRYDKREKQMVFYAYMGTDYSVEQSENPQVIISRDRNKTMAMSYSHSTANHKNTVLINGWTDDNGVTYSDSIQSGTGLKRREIFVKGSTSQPKADENEGITLAEATTRYAEEQRQKGMEQLASHREAISLDVDLSQSTLRGLKLGDKVTALEKKYNTVVTTHIAEITAFYEKGGAIYNVVLGDAVPSFYRLYVKTGR